MPRKGATAEKPAEVEETPAAEAPKEPLTPGPTTTRTGAAGLVIETPHGTRTFTAGGSKGEAAAELLREGKLSRKEIAEKVGCSPSRVAEVARVLGLTKERKKIDVVEE